MVSNPVAISTRVAPSFLRVGQLELFALATLLARSGAHFNMSKAQMGRTEDDCPTSLWSARFIETRLIRL